MKEVGESGVAVAGPVPGSRVPAFCAVAVAVLAVLPLAGWWIGLEALKRPLTVGLAMNPTTSLAFLLGAAGLFLLRSAAAGRVARRAAAVAALAVVAIGALRLVERAGLGVTGVDLWFADAADLEHHRARMATTTAVAFALAGAGLAWGALARRDLRRFAQWPVCGSGVCALAAVVGYGYGVSALHGLMAVNTAVAFLLLDVGILAVDPELELRATLRGHGPGRVLVRVLLPALVGIQVALGALRLAGERRGWFAAEVGTAFFVVATSVLFAAVALGVARVLDRAERARGAAEAELRAAEERYRSLFDFNPLPSWVFDRETYRFLAVNEAAVRVYGYAREDFLAMTVDQIRPAEDVPALRRVVAAGTVTGRHGLWRHFRKDGSLMDVEIFGFWVDFAGRPGHLVVARDVTEERRMAAALERRTVDLEAANAELDAFSYSVSHDLRAPLRAIDGFSRALLEDSGERLDETGRDYLGRVRAAAQRMARLIDDLLDLSRVSRAELREVTTDLSALAREILAELAEREPERKVDVVVGDGLTAACDPRLIGVLLRNLLENAWKYTRTRERARIELGAETRDGTTTYFVRDDGVGFDMTYAGKLFAPFQRLHDARQFEGTGIGLATVQRIVHRHGGRVRAEAAPERGAAFYFTLGGGGESTR